MLNLDDTYSHGGGTYRVTKLSLGKYNRYIYLSQIGDTLQIKVRISLESTLVSQ